MRKPADIRKAEIVRTVLDLADRIGPDRVTTNAVAQAIGVTQAALFRHFPSKAALWEAVAEQVSDQLGEAWNVALRSTDAPVERLRALVGAQLAQIKSTPAMPMLLFSRELNVENDQLRRLFRDRLGAFHAVLATEIGQAQQLGAVRRDIEPADAAVLLSSLVQGVAIRWSLGSREFALVEEGLRLLDVQLQLLVGETKE
ncbi:TetR/AcrR family transcriptional regulator [Ostreiculturibacter nitratireducens]|uniref:TetR/AcrR family transcriptional regulator n=1 Tax=Ostreiculturibacter nitratireducens TaxID=3075226 RepID=UPI0031B5995F